MSNSWLSNSWVLELVAKYSNAGILVDSNLLFVFCIGILDRVRVSQEKGTREYTPEDFDIVSDFLGRFATILATPNILTELSNLTGRLREDVRNVFRRSMREKLLAQVEERYVPTKDAMAHFAFERLGLTDAAIGIIAGQEILILTSDLDLAIVLESRKLDCVLFRRDLGSYVLDSE